jgi:galactokinase
MSLERKIVARFKELCQTTPTVFIAPGRINLIGEHTDYNGGFVMPAAIDKHFVFAVSARNDAIFSVHALDLNEQVEFTLTDLKAGNSWVNYLMGVVSAVSEINPSIKGLNVVFGSNIPMGGGMSSSAALCSGFGFALNEIYHLDLTRIELAKISQSSEKNFAGANVGIMDPFASLHGKKDSFLFLDCRSLAFDYAPFQSTEYELLLIDTKVKHSLASSAYNKRRQACEEGVACIQKQHPSVFSLRDVSKDLLFDYREDFNEDTFDKCSYVIDEIERTRQALNLLKVGDLVSLGALMFQTHWGLSRSYEVSCPELDLLVSFAEKKKEFFIGSRMMGGGFGGCTINLIKKESTIAITDEIKANYFATFKTEPNFYPVTLEEGVHLTKNLNKL